MQDRGIDVGCLAGSGVEHGLSFEPPPLPRCRVAVHGGDEAVELGVDAVPDLVGSGRVGLENDVVNVGDLGDPVLRCPPSDPQLLRQFGTEGGVVERRESALVALDQSGVEGEPSAVGRLHPVRDDNVGVDLRIERTAGVLSEQRGDDPVGVDDRDLAADAVPGVGMSFDPAHERLDGEVVGVEDSSPGVVVAECEEYGHGLRRRAGDVETSDRVPAVDAAEVPVRVVRDATVHHGEEVLVDQLTDQAELDSDQAELDSGRADPAASGFVGVEVVVRELLDVVAAGSQTLQGRHPNGHSRPPNEFPDGIVHSSVMGGWGCAGFVMSIRGW